MSLKQLIENCKKRDAQAQSQLYKQFASKLFSLCLKYSRNYAEAEDNLHETFLTIFNKIDQFNHQGSFEGWLKRIAINTALQKYREHIGVFDIVNEEKVEDTDVEIDGEELSLDFLLSIIQELPDRYRLVFNLYALDGYSHAEISDLVGISVGTSKSNLARARTILKTKIEDYKANLNSQSI